MSPNAHLEIFGLVLDGWPALLGILALWLAPAGLILIVMGR